MRDTRVSTVVVGLLLVVLSTGCGGPGSAEQSSPLEAAGGRTPAQPAEVESAPPPPAAEGGVPFNLSTHCGIGATTFRGSLWDPFSVEPGPSPAGDPVEPGTMHLEEPDHAVFLGESGLRVDFRPAAPDTPTPLCS